MHLLDAHGVDPTGLHAVVVGHSPILGKPVGMLLLAHNATVTYCHSRSVDRPRIVADADIVGDVEYAAAADRARLITPVPGGVGPTTIAVLLKRTVRAAQHASSRSTSG